MMNANARFVEVLKLNKPPIAIGFLAAPPANIPKWSGGAQPAGCAFWKQAMQGEAFYTVPADHYNCAVGSYTHGIPLPKEREHELQDTVEFMVENNYIAMSEVPGIPKVEKSPTVIAFAPLANASFKADVILLAVKPAQAMIIYEAAIKAGLSGALAQTLGRPACAVLPLTMASSQMALSLGCKGNRTFTGLADEEMYISVPADKWQLLADKLTETHDSNVNMENFYRSKL